MAVTTSNLVASGTTVINTSQIPLHTHTLSTWPVQQTILPQAIENVPNMPFIGHKKGHRIPEVDRRLGKLWVTHGTENKVFAFYRHADEDKVIEALGDYNPLYSGRPKHLAMALLYAAAGRDSTRKAYMLQNAGLTYCLPALVGVRKRAVRTSAVGLKLLDYWAEKFPKFAPFVAAFVTKKARKEIICDCVDFSLDMFPACFREAEEKNKLYQVKWEAREYRRIKKEEAEKKAMEERIKYEQMRMQQAQLQAQANAQWQAMQAQAQYQSAISNQHNHSVVNNQNYAQLAHTHIGSGKTK